MSYAFNRCEKIRDINLGYINPNNLQNMCGLFNGCETLNNLKSQLSSWKTKSVKDMSMMFQGCKSLTQIDIKSYDTSELKDISGLFSGCQGIKKISLSKWTSAVTIKEMIGMFNDCQNLEKIEFPKIPFKNVSDASGLFYKCGKLRTITNGDYLVFNDKTILENVFDQCTSLSDKDKDQVKSH